MPTSADVPAFVVSLKFIVSYAVVDFLWLLMVCIPALASSLPASPAAVANGDPAVVDSLAAPASVPYSFYR